MENQKVKLMCSYGGKIQLRPHDHQLSYVGGDTKILTVDRNIKFIDMVTKLNATCNCTTELCIKYQLPGEDLDALVSIVNDDDVEQMMFEYDRMQKLSKRHARLRLFLFYAIRLPESSSPLNPDFLFGFDKEYNPNTNLDSSSTPTDDLMQLQIPESGGMTGQQVLDNSNLASQSHVDGGAYGGNAVQMVYGIPMMMTGGYHHTGFGQYSVVPGTGSGRYVEQPVYNFVPASTTTVPTSMIVPSPEQ